MVEANNGSAVVRQAGDDGKQREWHGATSQDYLEKVFQIPSWVRPMEDEVARESQEQEDQPESVRCPPGVCNVL